MSESSCDSIDSILVIVDMHAHGSSAETKQEHTSKVPVCEHKGWWALAHDAAQLAIS